jgi:peroxiredoxin
MTSRSITFTVGLLLASALFMNACAGNYQSEQNNIEQNQPAKQPSKLAPYQEKTEPSTPATVPNPSPSTESAPVKTCADIGCPAPEFTLSSPDGVKLSLSSLKGKKVILAFVSTRCGTCLEVITCLQKVYGDWTRDQMELVAIVSKEQAADVEHWKYLYGVENPVVLDPTGDLLAIYNPDKIPTLYFLDAKGVIQKIKSPPFDDCTKNIEAILSQY